MLGLKLYPLLRYLNSQSFCSLPRLTISCFEKQLEVSSPSGGLQQVLQHAVVQETSAQSNENATREGAALQRVSASPPMALLPKARISAE